MDEKRNGHIARLAAIIREEETGRMKDGTPWCWPTEGHPERLAQLMLEAIVEEIESAPRYVATVGAIFSTGLSMEIAVMESRKVRDSIVEHLRGHPQEEG